MAPLRSFTGGGFSFLFQAGLILRNALIDFRVGALAGIAILFLKQAGEDIELAGGPIQIIVGEFAPLRFGFASDLFPMAFEYIFVHRMNLLIL